MCLADSIINICPLGSPSTSIKEINARQSLVGFFHARPHLRDDILRALGDMEDASRIVQKFTLGRGDPGDLSAIHSTVIIWASVKSRIELERRMEERERGAIIEEEWASVGVLMSRMSDLRELANRISMALRQKVDVTEEETPASEVAIEEFCSDDDLAAPQTKPRQPIAYDSSSWTIKPEYALSPLCTLSCLTQVTQILRTAEDPTCRPQRSTA